jgi:hypothetical protein
MVLIASAAAARLSIRRVAKQCGSRVWSIASIALPSAVGQIAR